MADELTVELPAKGATVGVEVSSRRLSATKKLAGETQELARLD